ncbi:ATP-dependent RNA circularization protein (DNA/RNA ligase family) [Clostridium acetobutylicum]|uniref:Homolog of eukaryotic DNA ligase III n=1 Tax=Clostridium acetobutylicum (strain ATCC 824 / DSM 792 / JCM 1419 / IAM 19013 / LMG 5710 / NBRC 13948 / NRRL B-527 / VKM B-1787 / 2291 / W) TaxID=272562 RepID=Q97L14_CLOAB|nr:MULTISPECIES: RNA ligase family protein [Clostridium]AAK78728.1 Homolog of eukaryotic DNA ligase III [Clostridium acetobutylicum ATCC 824]ADZ19802.1 Eukaryotic DNA ligase III [Clostridium acetobutylicum EA 2018]AEI31416.1 DNA ligase III [Clostridium acetobutylicum DSM 1731]AWV80447.1 DNA ligase [Clostridium acetobutylicum]MBC2392637.1 RNA ligase family protein [Clostridium acetobutylicum]
MERIYKYPRTPHLEGSRFQQGDEDLEGIKFENIKNRFCVLEEKVDGANCGISFDTNGKMYLQSRGHFLNGGYGEKQFDLFKTWANCFKCRLWSILGDRYVMYGEWLYAKHTVFYDKLSHYFMEFDIFDKKEEKFLSTKRRKEMLKDYGFIKSVLVLKEGIITSKKEITTLLGKSNFKSHNWRENLEIRCSELTLSYEIAKKQTDLSDLMEGIYIKLEDEDYVLSRMKYVRASFLNTIMDSETHWISRPIIPNRLKVGINIFDGEV